MKLPTDQDDWNRESSSEGGTAIHSCKNQETYFEANSANTAHEMLYSSTVPFRPDPFDVFQSPGVGSQVCWAIVIAAIKSQ